MTRRHAIPGNGVTIRQGQGARMGPAHIASFGSMHAHLLDEPPLEQLGNRPEHRPFAGAEKLGGVRLALVELPSTRAEPVDAGEDKKGRPREPPSIPHKAMRDQEGIG